METKINEPQFESFPAKTTLYEPRFESGTRTHDTKTKLSDNRKSRFHYLCLKVTSNSLKNKENYEIWMRRVKLLINVYAFDKYLLALAKLLSPTPTKESISLIKKSM